MKLARLTLLLSLGAWLAACTSSEVPTRNAGPEQVARIAEPTVVENQPTAVWPGQVPVTVNRVTVQVPRDLKASEANLYLPLADIVWREDPVGDRHAQVQAILQNAMERGVQSLNGPVVVDLDVRVRRFHALTQKARYTTGGVHSIIFDLSLKDPETGALLVPPRTVQADLKAYGGRKALQAEARGETQKVRITNHIARVIQQELTSPDGYKNASLGFYQMLNNL